MTFGVYENVRGSSFSVWTPIPWFLLASAIYYGVGPLVYLFGTIESVEYMDGFFPVDAVGLLRTNLLNAVGVVFILGSFLLIQTMIKLVKPTTEAANQPSCDVQRIRLIMWVFLIVGLSVQVGWVLPYKLGMMTDALPGAVQHIGTLSKVAIILLWVLVHRGQRSYQWLLYALICVELGLGFMTFMKQDVIEVLLAAGLGWWLGRPRIRSVIIGFAALVLLYVFILTPFMAFGRIAYKSVGVESFQDVLNAAQSYWELNEEFVGYTPGVQTWWTRLSYANAQTFAMESYDHAGQKAETLSLAMYAFVPRILVPSKPIISPGRDFTSAVMGEDFGGTSTAPGVFAEAYWHGGWIFTIALAIYIGFVLAAFTTFAEGAIKRGRYEYLPLIMTGLGLGYQLNDWFAMVYVGAVLTAIALYLITRFLIIPLLNAFSAYPARFQLER
jgi:hypothetical protein